MEEIFSVDLSDDTELNSDEIPLIDKSNQPLDAVDEMAATKGYVSRAPRRRTRKRTGQIHSWVYPQVRQYLLDEAYRRRVQQGVILEEALELYKKSGNAG